MPDDAKPCANQKKDRDKAQKKQDRAEKRTQRAQRSWSRAARREARYKAAEQEALGKGDTSAAAVARVGAEEAAEDVREAEEAWNEAVSDEYDAKDELRDAVEALQQCCTEEAMKGP